MILKRTFNKIRSATVQLCLILMLFLISCAFPYQLLAQAFDQHAVSIGAGVVSGGNYTGYASAGQMATYLYSNGTQVATQGFILNEINPDVEFTFALNGNLTQTENLKAGQLRINSSIKALTGNPLANADVYLVDSETGIIYATTRTDANGYFEFKNVPYRNFIFLVNTTEIPENPIVLAFESNVFIREVIVNGEVGKEGITTSVTVAPNNSCNPDNPDYKIWYRDYDNDGYGNSKFSVGQCSQPEGYVLNNLDSNDTNPAINPDTKFECIELKAKPGWNIFSVNVTPETANLKFIFKPFIDDNTIVKIQDKTGKALENWGIFGGWINDIGKVSVTEGYKIKLSQKDSVIVCGIPVKFPFPIPLNEGWNIMGYPQTTGINGMEVVQQLITRGTLVKVQDEAGNSIENWGTFGGWQNSIGDFMPGEGYKIKVSKKDTLWIYENYPKSAADLLERSTASHFIPEFEGNGIDHMNVNLIGLPATVFKAGDELAIFDGETCVGAVTLMPYHLQSQTISIVASATDNQGMPGFNEGNPFTLKFWNSQQNTELILGPEILKGASTFAKNETTFASLEKYATTGLEVVTDSDLPEIKCYPNPFSNMITVEINLSSDAQVQVEVLNQLGQRVKMITTKQQFTSGVHRLTWNGRNSGNGEVSQGIYHLKINVDGKDIHRKIVYSK